MYFIYTYHIYSQYYKNPKEIKKREEYLGSSLAISQTKIYCKGAWKIFSCFRCGNIFEAFESTENMYLYFGGISTIPIFI